MIGTYQMTSFDGLIKSLALLVAKILLVKTISPFGVDFFLFDIPDILDILEYWTYLTYVIYLLYFTYFTYITS